MKRLPMLIRRGMLRHFPPVLTHAVDYLKNVALGEVEPELRAIPSLTNSSMVSIDAGAHMGLFSRVMARSSLRVCAFEPQSELFRYLTSLGMAGVTVENAALGNREGRCELRVPVDAESGVELEAFGTINPENAFGTVEVANVLVENVRVRRLDDYSLLGDRLGFVKVDVEGNELDLLEGGRQTVLREMPKLMIEISRHLNPSYLKVFRLLRKWNYGAFVFDPDSAEQFVPFAFEDPARAAQINRNFIFLPGEGWAREN